MQHLERALFAFNSTPKWCIPSEPGPKLCLRNLRLLRRLGNGEIRELYIAKVKETVGDDHIYSPPAALILRWSALLRSGWGSTPLRLC